jgi:hypothetical protein
VNEIRDILIYLFRHYPRPNSLSKARVIKMVYLADWRHAIQHDKPITKINWIFNHYGPYVADVVDAVRHDPDFDVVLVANAYGEPKELIRVKAHAQYKGVLSTEAQDAIDHIIDKTSSLLWDDFIRLVYSTYPVLASQRYAQLDLGTLAQEYKNNHLRAS